MCVVWLLLCRKVPLPFAVSTWFAKLVGFPIVAAARKAQGGLHLEWPSPLLVFVLDGNFVLGVESDLRSWTALRSILGSSPRGLESGPQLVSRKHCTQGGREREEGV